MSGNAACDHEFCRWGEGDRPYCPNGCEPLPTEPDPRLVQYVDHGEPGDVATFIFCAALVFLSLVALGWIAWEVASNV